MVVIEVDGMIVRPMRRHELGLLLGEYIKEIMVLQRDDFSNKLPLVHWKWLGMEGGSWGRIVSNGSKLCHVLRQTDQPVAEGKDLVALVYQLLEGCGSNKTDWGWPSPFEQDGVHLPGRVADYTG